jgi:uncharacterized protein YsxB (DUF464 family)
MIRVVVQVDGPNVMEMTVSGHANAADKGEDLICAGVSAITVGTLNALDELVKGSTNDSMKEGYIHISVNTINPTQQTILQSMLIQLKSIQEAHPKYITIKKQEV